MSSHFDQILALVKAGAHVLHIASYEWERVRGIGIGLARELKLPLRAWNSSAGMLLCDQDEQFQTEDEAQADPIEVIKLLSGLEGGGILLLEDIQPYLEPAHHEVIRWVRQICQRQVGPRRLLLLCTPLPGLPIELRKEVPTLEIPLPNTEELQVTCLDVAEHLHVPMEDCDALLEAARGLTVMEAKLAFGQAAVQLGRLGKSAVPLVAHEKERVIRQSEVLQYYEPDARMTDVGGLENLKTWLERRGRAFSNGAREFGLDAPKGVLLLGVQGCGKSLLAKAIASAWQFPLLRFDMGKVFGGIVGQSEGNIRAALQVAQALAPCVLWIDEIEKGLAGMGSSDASDAGTTARVVGTMLTWMQEKRDAVFVVATANRIEMLPPELLRKGRFDEIFFVDLPSRKVREEILSIHLRKKRRDPADFDLKSLAAQSVGYSGAELEEAVREGLFTSYAAEEELKTDHVTEALKATYPLSRTMRDQITDLRAWAKVRARLASAEEAEPVPEDPTGVPQLAQETRRNLFIPRSSSKG